MALEEGAIYEVRLVSFMFVVIFPDDGKVNNKRRADERETSS